MSKQVYFLIGGVAVLAAIGVAGWFLFQDTTVSTNTASPVLDTNARPGARATLAYQQGSVEVNVDGVGWNEVENDTVLFSGDSVRTGIDSKAILEFENGDIVRLGYSTEVTLLTTNPDLIQISQTKGATYNRVTEGLTRVFQVASQNTTIEAVGTAFDVLLGDETIDVNVVESKVKVMAGDEEKEVEAGKTASIQKVEKTVAVNDFDTSKLSNDWYSWNKEEDQKNRKKLGILEEAQNTEENKEANENTEENAGETENKEQNTEQEENKEQNQEEQKQEEPEPEPEPEPTYTGPSLSATAQEAQVGLWWSDKSGNPGFKYYKVVRSETNAEPVYPTDGYIAVRSKGEENWGDKTAVKGKSYYYRICAVGDEVLCGNVRKITAINVNEKPDPVTLSGVVDGDSIKLTWTKSAISDFSFYKVVWSKTDSTPTYPENGHVKAVSDKATVTYTHSDDDEDLMDGTHYYSVCVVDSASQVACSNTVTVVDGVVQ